MGEPHLPRVNLPDIVPRKPLVPGQNSWAQQQQQQEAQQRDSSANLTNDTRPTNRDKYEHKPMPPTPPADEGLSPEPSFLQPKAYIQPAIPLIPPPFKVPSPKMRAVTDPIPPKPLFAGRKVSVKQLRKKYSQTKGKDETSNEGLFDDNQPSPPLPVTSEKAAQVLGISSAPDNGRRTPGTSAMSAPAGFRTSHEGFQEQTVPPTRQVQSSPVPERSTPVPTRRYLKENGLMAPAPTEASNTSKQVAHELEQSAVGSGDQVNGVKPQETFLHPARVGTHTNVGEVGLVEGPGMHRVESFRGIIEDVPISASSSGQKYGSSNATSSQPSTGRDQGLRDPVLPDTYTPSNYGGVWENDPAVVSLTMSMITKEHALTSTGSYSPSIYPNAENPLFQWRYIESLQLSGYAAALWPKSKCSSRPTICYESFLHLSASPSFSQHLGFEQILRKLFHTPECSSVSASSAPLATLSRC